MKRTKGDVCAWIRQLVTVGDHVIIVGAAGEAEVTAALDAGAKVTAFDGADGDEATVIAGTRGRRAFFLQGQESSLYRANAPNGVRTERQAITLDDCDDAALIMLDAQGAEDEILQGAPRQLGQCPHLIVECWPVGLHGANTSAQGLLQTLQMYGYRVIWTEGDDVTPETLAAWEATGAVYVNWRANKV